MTSSLFNSDYTLPTPPSEPRQHSASPRREAVTKWLATEARQRGTGDRSEANHNIICSNTQSATPTLNLSNDGDSATGHAPRKHGRVSISGAASVRARDSYEAAAISSSKSLSLPLRRASTHIYQPAIPGPKDPRRGEVVSIPQAVRGVVVVNRVGKHQLPHPTLPGQAAQGRVAANYISARPGPPYAAVPITRTAAPSSRAAAAAVEGFFTGPVDGYLSIHQCREALLKQAHRLVVSSGTNGGENTTNRTSNSSRGSRNSSNHNPLLHRAGAQHSGQPAAPPSPHRQPRQRLPYSAASAVFGWNGMPLPRRVPPEKLKYVNVSTAALSNIFADLQSAPRVERRRLIRPRSPTRPTSYSRHLHQRHGERASREKDVTVETTSTAVYVTVGFPTPSQENEPPAQDTHVSDDVCGPTGTVAEKPILQVVPSGFFSVAGRQKWHRRQEQRKASCEQLYGSARYVSCVDVASILDPPYVVVEDVEVGVPTHSSGSDMEEGSMDSMSFLVDWDVDWENEYNDDGSGSSSDDNNSDEYGFEGLLNDILQSNTSSHISIDPSPATTQFHPHEVQQQLAAPRSALDIDYDNGGFMFFNIGSDGEEDDTAATTFITDQ